MVSTRRPVVFVVDANEAVRRMMSGLVTSAGLPTRACASLNEFLQNFDPEQPGCLLFDIRVPGTSVAELKRKLIAGHVHLPVILVDSHPRTPSAPFGPEAEGEEIAVETCSAEVLLDSLRRAIARDTERRKGSIHRPVP
jgi:two-component system, LuxR family, response regulator FixJ